MIHLTQRLAHCRHSKNISSIHFLSSLQSQFRVISGMFYEAFLPIVGNAEQLSESQDIKKKSLSPFMSLSYDRTFPAKSAIFPSFFLGNFLMNAGSVGPLAIYD